jgi:hypothetical protein
MTNNPKIIGLAQQIISLATGSTAPAPDPQPSYVVVADMAELKAAISDGVADIRLADSEWPDLTFDYMDHKQEVHISPLNGYSHAFPPISVRRSAKLTFDGFKLVNPSETAVRGAALASAGHDAMEVKFLNLKGYASSELIADPKAYADWSKDEWLARKIAGVSSRSPGIIVEDCEMIGAYMSFSMTGEDSQSRRNRACGVPGDGFRLIGDYSISEDDYVEDMFQIDGNHSDVCQSWSIGDNGRPGTGVRRGLTIRRLVARQWTLGDDTADNPLRAHPQGIGLFDGMFEDLVIEDCDLDVGAYHGISVYGGINATIRRNKVWDHFRPAATGKYPWIRIGDHKSGAPSTGSIIEGNRAQTFVVDDPTAKQSGNTKVNVAL